jgi:general nucleoside transport system permease protein
VSALVDIAGTAALYGAAVRLATPIFLASLGEVVAERAGLVNVGLEGMMLCGAFGGVAGSDLGGVGAGIVLGVLCGVLVAVLQSVSSITLGADQIVVGIALNITAIGVTSFLARTIWTDGNVPQVAHLNPVGVPLLDDIPFLGGVLFRQNPLVYAAGALAVAGWWVLTRTGWGLRVRACGEDPRSADSLGIPVIRLRWESMLICGALAGLGGVFLSLGELFTFSDAMSGGRGFIALAVVIVARWSPVRAVLGALLFGLCEAIAFRVQAEGVDVPYELMLALPYVVTLLVYAGVVGRTVPPAALGRNYVRR